jgi:hypothetical protein
MHDVAVRVGPAAWREWLTRVADTRALRGIEVPADLLLDQADELPRRARHLGLSLLQVTDVVPVSLSRHLGEVPLADDETAMAALACRVRESLPGQVRFASLDVGLDRLAGQDFDQGLRRRVRLLRSLAGELAKLEMVVAVSVRVPRPFAGSRQWEWAGNLLHEAGEPRCRLAVDVVLPDLAEGFDAAGLLRDCAAHLGVLRLHFRWRWGEVPTAAQWEAWATALRHHPGPLGVVFCPREPVVTAAPSLLADIEGWAARM